uniref:Peroxisomal multifunctional enzyme putative n=1 Tax=Albugo laibachii Nc14 TaxID=890382 RepID=F0WR33_9STRA|nr:peroxisomal multifunctional enzyme putative [Albugo laibachii Nc14]|eukprot:CCA23793.1 peroxisomal multifunctional enzyme putative [Albugo laibachii Nc14]
MSLLRFDGKVAIITGAGAGLGRAYALLLASRGANVIVNDISRSDRGTAADDVVKEIRDKGGNAVADYNSVVDGENVVATALKHYNKIDIVVNNAGILRDQSFAKMKKVQWNAVLDVHLKGTFAVTFAAWPHMRQQNYGRIVLITSTTGLYGRFGQGNYAAAKSGMIGFGKTLAKEGASRNIKVNMVAPTAGSAMTKNLMPPEMFDQLKPESVAPMIAYLCHEDVASSGRVFESFGGQMSEVKWTRSKGHCIDASRSTAIEDVRDHWSRITDFEDAIDPEKEELRAKDLMEKIKSKL